MIESIQEYDLTPHQFEDSIRHICTEMAPSSNDEAIKMMANMTAEELLKAYKNGKRSTDGGNQWIFESANRVISNQYQPAFWDLTMRRYSDLLQQDPAFVAQSQRDPAVKDPMSIIHDFQIEVERHMN